MNLKWNIFMLYFVGIHAQQDLEFCDLENLRTKDI